MGLLELAACGEGLFSSQLLRRLPLHSLGLLQCTCRALRTAVTLAPEQLWQALAAEAFPPGHPVLGDRPVAAYLSEQAEADAAIGESAAHTACSMHGPVGSSACRASFAIHAQNAGRGRRQRPSARRC